MARYKGTPTMKHLALALALTLPACATLPTPLPAPVATADTTVLDEQAAITGELLYRTGGVVLDTALAAGLIDRPRYKALDQRAYTALTAVRASYRAGNATGYATALTELRGAVSTILASVKGF